MEEENTMTMTWVSFPNLLPIYFVEEVLVSLASSVCTLMHLDMAIINKTRPSCAKDKVLVDLMSILPDHVRMNIEDESIKL